MKIKGLYNGLLLMALLYLVPLRAGSQSSLQAEKCAPVDVPDATVEMLTSIYKNREFSVKSFRAEWYPDGSGYLALERFGDGGNALILYDVETGEPSELVSSDHLEQRDLPQ